MYIYYSFSSNFNMAEKLKDERASFRKIEESEAEPLRRQRQIMPSKKRVQNKISGELVIYFWRFFFTFLCGSYFCFWKLVLTTKKVPSISLIKIAQEIDRDSQK